MTNQQFKQVFEYANKGPTKEVDCSALYGLVFSTEERYATIEAAATFLVWQCMNLNGEWMLDELEIFKDLYLAFVELR